MKLAISQNILKPLLKAVFGAIAAGGMVGFGYLGCQVFGRTTTFTTAGCLAGLGATAGLVETIKKNVQPSKKKGA